MYYWKYLESVFSTATPLILHTIVLQSQSQMPKAYTKAQHEFHMKYSLPLRNSALIKINWSE